MEQLVDCTVVCSHIRYKYMYYSLILDLFLQLQLKDMAVEIVYFVYFLETALSSQF